MRITTAGARVGCQLPLGYQPDAAGQLTLETEASEAVDGQPHDGSLLHVKHTLVCAQVGTARSGGAAHEARHTFGMLGEALQCLLGVEVYKTGFAEGAHVVATTANGVEVHGRCDPPQPAVDAEGWFACARRVPLPLGAEGGGGAAAAGGA